MNQETDRVAVVMRPLRLAMGALCPTFSEQVKEHGITLPANALEKLDHLQRDSEAISRLSIRGLLPDSHKAAAQKKLEKRLHDFFRGA